jgi:hypothetical protein
MKPQQGDKSFAEAVQPRRARGSFEDRTWRRSRERVGSPRTVNRKPMPIGMGSRTPVAGREVVIRASPDAAMCHKSWRTNLIGIQLIKAYAGHALDGRAFA